MLGVSAKTSPGFPKRDAVPDGGENVLQIPAPRTVVEHLGGGGDRDLVALGPLAEKRLLGNLAVRAMPGNDDMEVLPEGFPKKLRRLARRGFLLEGGGAPSPERVESFGVRDDLFPKNPGGSLAGWRTAPPGSGAQRIFWRVVSGGFVRVRAGVGNGGGAPEQAPGQQPAQIPVAGPVADEQQDASRRVPPVAPGCRCGDGCFGAEHEPDTPLPRGDVGLDGPVQTVSVRERNPGKTEGVGLFDQFLGMARPFQEGSVALAKKREVHSPGRVIRRGLRGTMNGAPGRRKPSRHRRVSDGQKSSHERPAVPKAGATNPRKSERGR